MPIRFPREGNPLYPLPPDYESLSPANKRKARLNAVALRETPEDMVWAWSFFRQYYLNHSEAYFYKEFKESPPFHYELISFYRQHQLNAIAAPRAGAKSTVIGTELPLLEICSPSVKGMEICLLLAKDSFVEQRFDKLMIQIDENDRIKEDFGTLRCEHGQGVWNKHLLRLANHVKVVGISVDGKKRGQRPDLLIVDDPEYDPESGTDLSRVNNQMDQMLKRQVLGMLEPWSRMYWIGTLLSRKSYLYHIVNGQEPAFSKWNRQIYSAEYVEPGSSKTSILWESKWSPEYLEERRQQMGEGAYRTEYCNDPRGDDETVLGTDPVLTGYNVVGDVTPDEYPQNTDSPLSSQVEIEYNHCYQTPEGVLQSEPHRAKFGDFARKLKRYITVDYAPSINAMSDYNCVLVVGMDSKNTLWVLDGWHGRCRSPVLIQRIWHYARKWATPLVGVEAVSVQDEIRQQVADYMGAIAERGEWTPRVVPIRYPGGVSKSDRIGGLEWRFNRGRIKLPEYLKSGHSTLHELYEQIGNFTPDLSLLPHDDVIDALSMVHYLLPSGHKEAVVGLADPQTIPEMILSGRTHLDDGGRISLLSGLSVQEYTPELIDYLMHPDNGQGVLAGSLARHNYVGPHMDERDFA